MATLNAYGTGSRGSDTGPSKTRPGFVSADGVHRVQRGAADREYFILDNNSQVSGGLGGQVRIEWVATGELIGAEFDVAICSNNSNVSWRSLGRIVYNRRTSGATPSFVATAVGKGPVQYDKLTIPNAVMLEHDSATQIWIAIKPRGNFGAKITGLQASFSD